MIDAGLAQAIPQDNKADEDKDKKKKPDIRRDFQCEITPHYLRHNYITMLYNAGVDPLVTMRLVGHSDYKTTAQIYTHLHKMHIDKAAEKIDDVFSEKKVAEKLPDIFPEP